MSAIVLMYINLLSLGRMLQAVDYKSNMLHIEQARVNI